MAVIDSDHACMTETKKNLHHGYTRSNAYASKKRKAKQSRAKQSKQKSQGVRVKRQTMHATPVHAFTGSEAVQ